MKSNMMLGFIEGFLVVAWCAVFYALFGVVLPAIFGV